MNILLSIIIPVYNVAQYLPKCFQSLQIQNFPVGVEIILVDDGSTDESGRLCDEEASRKSSCYKVIHTVNRGVAAARNRGVEEAQGEYIAWIDPDDYITDDWWQVIEPILIQKPEMIHFDVKVKNEKVVEDHYDSQSRILSRKELIQALAADKIPSYMPATIVPRRFYDNCRFDEAIPCYEDYDLMHRLTFSVPKCIYLHNCLYVYQERDNSITHDDKRKVIRTQWMLERVKQRFKFYREHGIILDEYPIARVSIKILYNYLIFENNSSLKKLTIEYRESVQLIQKYLPNFYFNKGLEVNEQCLLYLLFKKKKPLLWIFFRHPWLTITEMARLMMKV